MILTSSKAIFNEANSIDFGKLLLIVDFSKNSHISEFFFNKSVGVLMAFTFEVST